MDTYHKINTIYKRDLEAPGKIKPLIEGQYSDEVFKYLADNEWEFTEKVDGTNTRIDYRQHGYPAVEFGGRTDNAQMPMKLMKYLQETFTSTLFIEVDMPDLTLYGEGYGAGIISGGKYLPRQEFVLFDVVVHGKGKDGEPQDWWLGRSSVDDIADKLGIESVPVIGSGTLHDAVEMVKSGLKSEWGDFEAEGIVARPEVTMFNRKGERVIAKIKGRDFKS